ncbi:MAG: chromosomal replication initiator protein DnaA [Rhodospirillaceae bacterium]|nr:chromosomal replication initiator protein DnaA [Rhodospirillaceae bacterium]OUT77332.1 MAG: chromosomal replication initiation protein DnaA [Rhodospirillaceae bacterium TMED23]
MGISYEDQSFQKQWLRISDTLKTEIGETAFENWVRPIKACDLRNSEVRLAVPSRFMRDWVVANYLERLKELWTQENKVVNSVDVIIQPSLKTKQNIATKYDGINKDNILDSKVVFKADPIEKSVSPHISDSQISAPLDDRFRFDQFVVGKPNEFAYAAARRVAQASSVFFNPLFLYGGVGLGKTHLMNAIAWEILEREPERTVMYLSAEKFMYRFVRALREKNTVNFKEQFRSVDVLMIDDVQFIGGRDATQEEFFHTFNALVDQGRQIILSADKSPSDLEGVEERLKSRLNCGLVADIHATTYELRLAILETKSEKMKLEVPRDVVEFLAHRITSNVRELEGALNRVAAHTQLVGRDLTLETAKDILHDLLRSNDRRVTIDEIQKSVAEHFNIRISDMHSARRARSVARPRQVAMYLSKQLTSRSLPEIGRKFGGRDHTTVMHAVKKVDELCDHDNSFAEDVDLLKRMLEG